MRYRWCYIEWLRHLPIAWMLGVLLVLGLGSAAPVAALGSGDVSITLVTGGELVSDSNNCFTQGPQAVYVGFRITNTSGGTLNHVQATLSGFVSGFGLAGNQPATQTIGTLANGSSDTLYWYVYYPCYSASPHSNTLTVTVSDGAGSAVGTGTITSVSQISANAGGLIESTTLGPGVVLGQLFSVDTTYSFGNIDVGDSLYMQLAGNLSYNARCFQLESAQVTSSFVNAIPTGITDVLAFVASASQTGTNNRVTVRYFVRYRCAGASTIAAPYGSLTSGAVGNKYSSNFGAVTIAFPNAINPFSITKVVTPTTLPNTGGTVTYTISIRNSSAFASVVGTITDVLPSGVTFGAIAGTSQVNSSNSSLLPSAGATGTLSFVPKTTYAIAAGSTLQLIYTANFPNPTANGVYTNSVTTVSGTETIGPAKSSVGVGQGNADLSVKKIAPASISAGGLLTYTITVTNNGPDPAAAVSIVDTLPAGVLFQSITAPAGFSCTTPGVGANGTITCSNAPSGTLANGATATLTIVTTAPSTPGAISNVATVTSASPDTNLANNSDTRNTTVQGIAISGTVYRDADFDGVLDITENWQGAPSVFVNLVQGSTIVQSVTVPAGTGTYTFTGVANNTYTIVVTNRANVRTPAFPGGWQFLAPSSGSRSVTVAGAPVTEQNFGLVQTTTLAVTKTTSTPTLAQAPGGVTATYTLTVSNTETAPAGRVRVTDSLASGFTYASTTSLTLNGTVVSDDLYSVITSGTQTPRTPQWTATTTGEFIINGGQTLVIVFTATIPGSQPLGTYNNSASTVSVNAPNANFDGTVSTADNVTLIASTAAIAGTVYHDLNTNGTLDAGETWSSGTPVFVNLVQGGVVVQSVSVAVGTGAYSFSGIVNGTYSLVLTNSASSITPTVPSGWVPVSPVSGSLTVSYAGAPITNQNFGLFQGSRLTGRVFSDTGVGSGGIANNGVQNGSESGIPNVTLQAQHTACAGGVCSTALTTSNGDYTLYIPAAVSSPVAIVEINPNGLLSTGGSAGTTGGTYSRATDTVTFTPTAGMSYSNVNFADVPVNTLAPDGQQDALPGAIVFYPHVFTAGSGGTVSFSLSNVVTPAIAGWSPVLYHDTNCNAILDSSETPLTSSLSMTAGTQVCLMVKEFVPTAASPGAQNQITLTATFAYTDAAPALSASLSRTDLTIVSLSTEGDLVLTKNVDKATAPLSTLTVNDTTPAFTVFVSASCGTPLPASLTGCTVSTQPAPNTAGALQWTLTGLLAPGGTGTVSYQVRIY